MTLDEVVAREQIRDALSRYARGVDRLDLDLALSAFHPGAVDHHGRNVGDPRTIFPLIFERLRAHVAGGHFLGCSVIEFRSASEACAETPAVGFHRIRTDSGLTDLRIGLRYVDRFEECDGTWAITHRHVLEDWRRADVVDDCAPGAFEQGRRDRSDRSYLFLG